MNGDVGSIASTATVRPRARAPATSWPARLDLPTPGADFELAAGDVLVVVGQPDQIKAAYTLLTGGEPA